MISLKRYKPYSPGLRGLVYVKNSKLYKGKPYKKLLRFVKNSSGRNNQGRITSWHKGGGHKKFYRIIDWHRKKYYIKSRVERIEYDPNRTAYIALLLYIDGSRCYVLSIENLKIGDILVSGVDVLPKLGNCTNLKNVPLGFNVSCIEMFPGSGGKLIRSAGCYAQVLAKDSVYATLRLKSGEIRKFLLDCFATIGIISKPLHNLRKLGKAGRKRWYNIRPRVRGVAMNPVDHPLGGGEGKSSGGRHPCTPWGKRNGLVTRKKNNSSKFIVKRRV